VKIKIAAVILFILSLMCSGIYASSFESPRIGIVISKATMQDRWMITQMSAHGWAGVANLAGIPYDCLYISDVCTDQNLLSYDLLVFAQCSFIYNEYYRDLVNALKKYVAAGGHVIIDGPLAVRDEKSKERDHQKVDDIFAMEYTGFRGDSSHRIQVAFNTHYITRPYEMGQSITQHIQNGLNTLRFKKGGDILLVSANDRMSFPFLSSRESKHSRIILVSDLATWSGVASFWRNEQPQVFYANQIFEILVRGLHWAIYGDIENPFPVPQLSNANMTVIIRLDGDGSANLDYQIRTINYLESIAKESGVVPVYGWVSDGATKAGWPNLAPLGKKIEAVGGQIATHSKYHKIDREMNERRWKEELDESIKEIEFGTSDMGYPIGKVEYFINPGNTIPMYDYNQLARRFTFYMTHGFCQNMPIGYGNLTWFTGDNKEFVILEDSPSMDYQWFYDPSWSYTTAQITAYEEAIFDHMYDNVGRGVVFNETWHDYSICSAQFGRGERIINKNNMAFYNAMKENFNTHDVYCPTPIDLANKLRAMAQWNYDWKSQSNRIELQLDLSKVGIDSIAEFIGGMGIKIENTNAFIQQVLVNKVAHYAFTDNLVILPNLKRGKNRIVVTLGDRPSRESHLTFVSKRMPSIHKEGNDLTVDILTKCRAKFNFKVYEPFILLNADWQEWNREGKHVLRGSVTSDRSIVLKRTSQFDFSIVRSTVPITDYKESKSAISIRVDASRRDESTIWFACARQPLAVFMDSEKVNITKKDGIFIIMLPEFNTPKEVIIKL